MLSFDRRVYRGPERRFADGTVLHSGDSIGELHLQNRHVLAIHARASHPVAAGLTFRRLLVASLRALARRAAEDPGLGNLRVFHSLTILVTGAERIGFLVGDDGVPARVRALFFHLLLCRYHAAGFARLPPTFLPARELWLTAAELQRRYGAEASPLMRVGTAPASGRRAHL